MGRTTDNPYNRLRDEEDPGATNWTTSHYPKGREWFDQYLDGQIKPECEENVKKAPEKEEVQHHRRKAREERAKGEEREETEKSRRPKGCAVM